MHSQVPSRSSTVYSHTPSCYLQEPSIFGNKIYIYTYVYIYEVLAWEINVESLPESSMYDWFVIYNYRLYMLNQHLLECILEWRNAIVLSCVSNVISSSLMQSLKKKLLNSSSPALIFKVVTLSSLQMRRLFYRAIQDRLIFYIFFSCHHLPFLNTADLL